ncbi:MAG TPA: YoaK family protein [Acidobacteriaceae bacterium]|nr:YoaK family protein [Acidobacteriaceae bacterium]
MPDNLSNPPADSSIAEHLAVGSLPSAILLALTGGSLDAFIYLNHGHVFAAAMTGNGVLLGVAILHHDYAQALRHLLPIFGFITGIFFANLLDKSLKHHAVTVGLVCEISALFVASFLPGHFPDLAFVPIIAIVAAYQVASFRTADNYAYNSTFMTGNLRTAVDGLYDALQPTTRKAGLRKFRKLSLIVLAFLAGATAGAILSPRLYNHTLWLINLPLIAVLILTLRGAHRAPWASAKKVGEPALQTDPPQGTSL